MSTIKILPYIGNKIFTEQMQAEFMEFTQWVKSNTTVGTIALSADRITIERLCRRSFPYPKNPTIKWLKGRIMYMETNNL